MGRSASCGCSVTAVNLRRVSHSVALAACAASLVMTLAACGSATQTAKAAGTCPSTAPAAGGTPEWTLPGATGSVAVTGSTDTTAPVITVTPPFSVTQTQVHTLRAGDGPVVAPTATASVCYVGVNGRDGSVFDSSYQRGDHRGLPAQRGGGRIPEGHRRAEGRVDGRRGHDLRRRLPRWSARAGIQPGDSFVFAIKILGAS